MPGKGVIVKENNTSDAVLTSFGKSIIKMIAPRIGEIFVRSAGENQ